MICRPTKPSGMAGVQVHCDVWKIQLRDGVVDAFKVGRLGVRALWSTQVRDQIGKRIRF